MTGESSEARARVRVLFVGWPPYGEPTAPRTVEVVGEANEPFVDALERTVGPPPQYHYFEPTTGTDADSAGTWLGRIEEHVTLADVSRFVDGGVLRIDVLGRGGGGLPLLWDAINTGYTLPSLVGTGVGMHKLITAARTRNQRLAAKEWLDAGTDTEPSLALRVFASEEREWERKEFDRRFRLGPEAGPKLLRLLGYRKVQTKPELWSDTRR